jgi:hypothetical protein
MGTSMRPEEAAEAGTVFVLGGAALAVLSVFGLMTLAVVISLFEAALGLVERAVLTDGVGGAWADRLRLLRLNRRNKRIIQEQAPAVRASGFRCAGCGGDLHRGPCRRRSA